MNSLFQSVFSKNVLWRQSLLKVRHITNFRNPTTLSRLNRLNPSISQKTFLSNAHDHSRIWVLEKAVSAGLLAVIPAALVYPNPILDYALALSLVAHLHWGFEAMVVDYIRPSLVGTTASKLALGSLYLMSILALAGLFYLNYSDVGVSTAIKMFARI